MDIALALSEGRRGAIARATDVAHHIKDNPEEFRTFLKLLSSEDEVIVSHASHALQTLGKIAPDLVSGYSSEIAVKLIENSQWELTEAFSKILSILTLNETEIEAVFDVLYERFETGKGSLLRTWALQALFDLSVVHPRFESRASKALGIALDIGSKAMQARARKLLFQ